MNQSSPIIYEKSNEIDLVDILQVLWRQKVLIISIATLVAAVAALYAFLTTPVYEVQSVLRPALIKDLDELNSSGIYELKPEDALKRVGASLDSYEIRRSFFEVNKDLFEGLRQEGQPLEQAFDTFSRESFNLLLPDPKKANGLTEYVGLQVAYPKGMNGVAIVNGVVAHAIEVERQRIAADYQVVIQNRLNTLARQIQAARVSYEADKSSKIAKLGEDDTLQRALLRDELRALRQQLKTHRTNRIAQLDEAIRIADSLDIRRPTTPAAMGDTERSVAAGASSIIRTEVNSQDIPLYFMGTEALEAERKALLQRRSDDFTEPRIAEIAKELQLLENNREIEVLQSRQQEDLFLSELAKLREEEARLKGLTLDLNALRLVRIDQPAVEPERPVKPQKLLILVLGGVLGGMLGIFIALVRGLLRRQAA